MGIGGTFLAGGGWMYPVTLMGVVVTIFVVLQFKRIQTHDYSRLLWSLLGAMIMIALLGTMIGLTQALTSLGKVADGFEFEAAMTGLGIAIIPTEHFLILGSPLTILIGITRHMRRKYEHPVS
jgi:polyferredoxin